MKFKRKIAVLMALLLTVPCSNAIFAEEDTPFSTQTDEINSGEAVDAFVSEP